MNEHTKSHFAFLIAQGLSQAEASRRAGISKPTGWRWAHDTDVKADVAKLRAAILDQAMARLTAGLTESIDAILGLVKSAKKDAIRLRAANAALSHFLKFRASVEQDVKLNELMDMLDAMKGEVTGEKTNGA